MKRLFTATLLMILFSFLCGFTLFGGDLSDAKKVTVPLGNNRIEAGSLIDGYKYFRSVKWAEEKQDDGSITISATAEYDAKLHFSDSEVRVSRHVTSAKNTEILNWLNANLGSSQSIAPVYVKFYFSRYTDSAMQRDYIARVYAGNPRMRDEIFQKMKNNEMALSPFYEIIFAQNPYVAKQSSPYKHPSPGNLFSLEALGEMLQQKPISEVGDGSYSIFLDYERHVKSENERAQAEGLGKLKSEMSQVLSRLPKPPASSFAICHGEGTVPGHITGSVYTLEGISLDTNPAHREASVEDRAFMSVWHFSVPAERKDYKGSIRAQGTGSKLYMLNNIQKESSGLYSVGWKADGVNFTLRWSESGYDLFWKDGQHVELMETLNPQEAFINACINKVDGGRAAASSTNTTKHMAVGYHEVTISGEPYEEQVFVNGGLAYDNADGDRALNIKEQFEIDSGDTLVFFLETLSGGTACPAMYRFIFAESDGQISITDSFGTCSDLPELRVSPESVMVVFPNMNGNGTTSYRLEGEDVLEVK